MLDGVRGRKRDIQRIGFLRKPAAGRNGYRQSRCVETEKNRRGKKAK
jgi:hypothetical protein